MIIIIDMHLDDISNLLLGKKEKMIQGFSSDRTNDSFGVGIHIWSGRGDIDSLDGFSVKSYRTIFLDLSSRMMNR